MCRQYRRALLKRDTLRLPIQVMILPAKHPAVLMVSQLTWHEADEVHGSTSVTDGQDDGGAQSQRGCAASRVLKSCAGLCLV